MVENEGKKKSVLMITFSHAPDDRRILREATALTEINWSVYIVFPKQGDRQIYLFNKINFIPVPLGRFLNTPFRFLFFWLLSMQLRKPPVQVLHCHDLNCLPLGWFWSKRYNLPLIYDSHEWGVGVYDLHNSSVKKRIWTVLETWLIKQAEVVITVNSHLARMLRRYRRLFDLPQVIRNASELKSQCSPRKLFKGNIAYLGGLMPGRNLTALLSALSELPQVTLYLIGDGKRKKAILTEAHQKNITNQIILTGWVKDIRKALSPVEIGLSLIPPNCSNNRLSSAGKVFDYVAMMIPQISSNFPVLKELVQNKGVGICIDPEEPAQLINTLKSLLNNPDEYTRLVFNINKNRGFYLWENEKKKLWHIYRKIY